MLADIKEIFLRLQIERIKSHDLIVNLCFDPQKRWGTYNRGKPISPRQVSMRLTGYGIKSKDVRFEDGVLVGLLSVHAMRLAKASNLGDKLSKHTL